MGKVSVKQRSPGKRKDKFSRRDILKLGGIGAAVAATAAVSEKVSAAQKAVAGEKRWAMVVDLRKCYGCHACQVACKAEFNVPLGVFKSWVKSAESGGYPDTKRSFLPRLCNHCKKAPCVSVCPVKASYRDDTRGIVDIRKERCIGCKMCIVACPYNARFVHPIEKVADKCDFCTHRVENGVEPACVNTCPANARIFGDLNDPNSEVSKLVNKEPVRVLKKGLGTDPSVFYIAMDNVVEGRIIEG